MYTNGLDPSHFLFVCLCLTSSLKSTRSENSPTLSDHSFHNCILLPPNYIIFPPICPLVCPTECQGRQICGSVNYCQFWAFQLCNASFTGMILREIFLIVVKAGMGIGPGLGIQVWEKNSVTGILKRLSEAVGNEFCHWEWLLCGRG